MSVHTPAFLALRDALLALDDEERRRLVELLGAMHAPKPPLSGRLAALLALIARLDPSDRRRLATWCARYLSRWGQVPVAASQTLATPQAGTLCVVSPESQLNAKSKPS